MADDAAAQLKILFVCTGNMHRSPLAERLLARCLPDARAGSAGTHAPYGHGIHPATRSVLAELGGDSAGFTTRLLTADLVEDAELVLGMEREHREAAVRLCPTALRRCFTLKEFVRTAQGGPPGASAREVIAAAAAVRGRLGPVPAADDAFADPWGETYDVLRERAQQIDLCVTALAGLLGVRAAVSVRRTQG
ncbi:low molecular weight phosphatase family protein [Streptomyces sp. NPDC057136]|uniref:arsenate reductase/protein-tyrosine-phosphatase family protein n=1 Tax=Streptomyces sp. NPDC057136 TaxID=3346029 RepID=UPI00363647DF